MTTTRAPRTKSQVFSLIGWLVVAVPFILVSTQPDVPPFKRVIAGLLVLVFSLFAAARAWLLIHPERLVIDDEGFTTTGMFGATDSVSWADIDAFHVLPARNPKKSLVGWTYAEAPGQDGGARRADAFDDPWEMAADDLAILLQSRLEASRK